MLLSQNTDEDVGVELAIGRYPPRGSATPECPVPPERTPVVTASVISATSAVIDQEGAEQADCGYASDSPLPPFQGRAGAYLHR